jgi:hypothetical protein
MKPYEGLEVNSTILDIGIDGGEWLASCLGRFTLGERTPGTRLIGGWVGTRAGLDATWKRKISCPCRESNPGLRTRSYTD